MTGTGEEALWALFGATPRAVLVTLQRSGRPQLSNVGYLWEQESRTAVISVTDSRAKTRNLRRDPRASLHVSTPDLGAYAVGEGLAELSPVAQDPHGTVVQLLVAHYRALQGEHPDWEAFRRAMVLDRRLLLRLPVERVYGWRPDR